MHASDKAAADDSTGPCVKNKAAAARGVGPGAHASGLELEEEGGTGPCLRPNAGNTMMYFLGTNTASGR